MLQGFTHTHTNSVLRKKSCVIPKIYKVRKDFLKDQVKYSRAKFLLSFLLKESPLQQSSSSP